MGGIPIRLKVTSGTTTYFDIKTTPSPLASTVNYHDSIIFKLNAGDTVELVVTSTGLGERVDGFPLVTNYSGTYTTRFVSKNFSLKII